MKCSRPFLLRTDESQRDCSMQRVRAGLFQLWWPRIISCDARRRCNIFLTVSRLHSSPPHGPIRSHINWRQSSHSVSLIFILRLLSHLNLGLLPGGHFPIGSAVCAQPGHTLLFPPICSFGCRFPYLRLYRCYKNFAFEWASTIQKLKD